MKGKVVIKTLGQSVGKMTGNILGVMPSNRRAEREVGMASHEHPPAQLCSVNAAGSVLHKHNTSVDRSHSPHSTILRSSEQSVPSVPRVVKRERNNNKKTPTEFGPEQQDIKKINRLF